MSRPIASDAQVREFRERFFRGEGKSATALGKEYGLGRQSASMILRGKARQEAGGPTLSALPRIPPPRGGRPRTKFSDEEVEHFRMEVATMAASEVQSAIASRHRMSKQYGSAIVNGRARTTAPGPIRTRRDPGRALHRDDVWRILEMLHYPDERVKEKEIAERFGISQSMVSHIAVGRKWRRVWLDFHAARRGGAA